VANHGRPAGCATNVKLKAVAAMLEREIERGKSILGDCGGRTRTAMAEQQRRAGHARIVRLNPIQGLCIMATN